MKKILILLGFLLPAQHLWAISNIENERPNLPEQGLSGALNLGLGGKTGDEQKQAYEGAAKIVYRYNDEIFMGLASGEYGETQHVKDTDNSFLHARWTHLLDKQWAIETFAQWETNDFNNLKARILAGGGGRYLVTQKKDVYSLAVGLGMFREYEKLNLISYEEVNYRWRMNTYYSYNYQINDQLSFINTTYFQPDVNDTSDYRVLFDMGFGVKVTSRLKLQLNYRVSYDSDPAKNPDVDPPIDNHTTNSEYKTTLSYQF